MVLTAKDHKKIITIICLIWTWRSAILHMPANIITNKRIAVDALLPVTMWYRTDICLDNSANQIHAVEEWTIMQVVEEYDYWVNKLVTIHVPLYRYLCNITVTLTRDLFWQQCQPNTCTCCRGMDYCAISWGINENTTIAWRSWLLFTYRYIHISVT
jgi:hypothetical protein